MSDSLAREIIKKRGGTIRMSEALQAGINRYTLYKMVDTGKLEKLSRGTYRLTDIETASDPDLLIVATRVPKAVICLISALSYHKLTTQIPHNISIALPKGVKTPKLDYPPIQVYRFSKESYEAGIQTQQIDGIDIKLYDPEKTLIDCFKFRNKIGMDVVLEALKTYRETRSININKLMKYAEVCRVTTIIKPYLEASL